MTKTNAQLYEDVVAKLHFTPSIHPEHITLATHEGIVTLGGTVNTYAEKHLAEGAVKSVSGVKAVVNELQVKFGLSFQVPDTDIARAAISALKWNVQVPDEQIKVIVENGIVTLTGEVDWWFQKQAAERVVSHLQGVKHVNNAITLKPSITPRNVEKEIVREFHRNAQLEAEKIQIEVQNRKVILKGILKSWAEIEEAVKAAWSAPGVIEVENQLRVCQ